MTAISSKKRVAFFKRVETANHRSAQNPDKLSFLAPASPAVKSKASDNLNHRQRTYKKLYRHRAILELHVESRQKQLRQINPVVFQYLNEHQKTALIEELEDTREMLNLILYLSAVGNQPGRVSELEPDAEICQNYIDWIRTSEKPEGFRQTPESTIPNWAKWHIGQQFMALKEDPIDCTIRTLDKVNDLRLYWVWGGALLDAFFTLCKESDLINLDAFNKLEAKLNWPAPITGNLSWMLYYLRLLLRIYVCLSALFSGISEEQKGVSTFERFISTINEHKYGLLNDLFWGSINLACYACLTYSKNARLGYAGDLLTAGFLIMDWVLSVLVYLEERKKYRKNCESLTQDIGHFETMLLGAGNELKKNILKLRLANAKQRLSDYQFEFTFIKLDLINTFVYATLLMLSFPFLMGLTCCVPMSIGITFMGAVLCFAVTVLFQGIGNLIPVIKSHSQRSRLQVRQKQLFGLLQQTGEDSQQEIVMIQSAELQQHIDHQKRLMVFQFILFLHSLVIDILFPVLVCTALFSVPIAAGIGMIAAGFALAVVSKWYINRFEPNKYSASPLANFNKELRFNNPSSALLFPSSHGWGEGKRRDVLKGPDKVKLNGDELDPRSWKLAQQSFSAPKTVEKSRTKKEANILDREMPFQPSSFYPA